MKNVLTTIAMTFLMLSSTLAGALPGTVADLPPDLREALLRDAICVQDGGASSGDSGQASLLASAVGVQDIPGAGGAVIGVIASVSGGCHCQGANCGTYVYLRSNSGYKLAFSGSFASLRPSRVYKNGHPSLSGKIQVSEAQAESVIYDWNGKSYAPSLCATVTQSPGRKAPNIVHHECSRAP